MSVRVMTAVFDRYPRAAEMLLALALADHAHDDGTHVYPSVPTLAQKTRRSERAVQYQLKSMIASGWLRLERQTTGRRGQANEYSISPEWLAGGDPIPPDTGASFAPVEDGDKSEPTGAIFDSHGCKTEQSRVKPIAPKPSLTVIEPNTPQPPTGGGRGFADLFGEYPRQVDEGDARAVWDRIAPDADLQLEMVRAVRLWRTTQEWQREQGRYVPKLAKWLRKQGWRNVPGYTAAPAPPAAAAPSKPAAPMPAHIVARAAQILGPRARSSQVRASARGEV